MVNEETIKAQLAFLEIVAKLNKSPLKRNDSFIDEAFWWMAPLDEGTYSSDHKPESPKEHIFEEGQRFVKTKENEHGRLWFLAFFGDVTIKGDLYIGFYHRVFITGNLKVEGILEIQCDSRLFVGGSVKADGIKVEGGEIMQNTSSELLNLGLMCEKIHAVEIILCERNVYAGKIESKLVIIDGPKHDLNIDYQNYETDYDNTGNSGFVSKILTIPIKSKYCLLSTQIEKIKALFNPKIFENEFEIEDKIDDPVREIFEALRDLKITFDENWQPVEKDWIWKKGQNND